MSDQEQVPQGSIPPKASPFAKPEGVSPVTPVAPGSPRPITVRLKSVSPAATDQVSDTAVTQVATPLSASPRITARVPIPEFDAAPASVPVAPVNAPGPTATVRLRPVITPAGGAKHDAPAITPAAAAPAAAPEHAAQFRTMDLGAAPTPVSPLQPQHPPTPGANPLPDGPKPPSSAQIQAAKSKTSRISLDSAIGVAPMSPMGADKSEPKTIRLKRPADLTAPTNKTATNPIRQTSRIPDSVLPTVEEAASESASVTQKKTLKIKRPGGAKEEGAAEVAAGEGFPEGVQMTALSPLDMPVKQESSVFTAFAVVAASLAAVVMLLLTLCLASHAVGRVAGANAVASLSGPELPWPGRIAE